MNASVLASTFLLTVLLLVGLVFFIRASVKDRTQQVTLLSAQPADVTWQGLQAYFADRAYAVTQQGGDYQAVFAGFVRPSPFLAVFLSLLAAIGGGCLALVLAILVPRVGSWFGGLVLLSPLAGVFYWRQAGRVEQVTVAVTAIAEAEQPEAQSQITLTAHRDEVLTLRQTLGPPLALQASE